MHSYLKEDMVGAKKIRKRTENEGKRKNEMK
jgi:hypothetical protein